MRLLSRSTAVELAALLVAVVVFVLLYETRMLDSRDAVQVASMEQAPLSPGTTLHFDATAYCKGTTTASGVAVRSGIAAADPSLLPVGSVVNVIAADQKYSGVYTVMDTGPKVQGRILDLYMWSCYEALAFGRTPIDVTVLRLGWEPAASSPALIDRVFRTREAARRAAREASAAPPADAPTPDLPLAASGDDEEDVAVPAPDVDESSPEVDESSPE